MDTSRYPDYLTVVPNPIDLGTIKANMEAGHYKDCASVKADVIRVFENACVFNPPGTDVHVLACTLRDRFEERWRDQVLPRIEDEPSIAVTEEIAAMLKKAEVAAQRLLVGHESAVQGTVRALNAVEEDLGDARAQAACQCLTVEPELIPKLVAAYARLPQTEKDVLGSLLPPDESGSIPNTLNPRFLDTLTALEMFLAGAGAGVGPATTTTYTPSTTHANPAPRHGMGALPGGEASLDRWQRLGVKRAVAFQRHGIVASSGARHPGRRVRARLVAAEQSARRAASRQNKAAEVVAEVSAVRPTNSALQALIACTTTTATATATTTTSPTAAGEEGGEIDVGTNAGEVPRHIIDALVAAAAEDEELRQRRIASALAKAAPGTPEGGGAGVGVVTPTEPGGGAEGGV